MGVKTMHFGSQLSRDSLRCARPRSFSELSVEPALRDAARRIRVGLAVANK